MENIGNLNSIRTEEQRVATQEWDIATMAEGKENKKREQLAHAILEAKKSGKETFDYEIFAGAYWRKNAFTEPLNGDESEEMRKSYEEEYYLDFPEVMNTKEFAEKLEERDARLEE